MFAVPTASFPWALGKTPSCGLVELRIRAWDVEDRQGTCLGGHIMAALSCLLWVLACLGFGSLVLGERLGSGLLGGNGLFPPLFDRYQM